MFIDPDHTTEAAVVERLVQFSSRHPDGSFVETMYPIGERIKGPDLVINRVRSSIADAYRLHHSVLTERAPVNGAPELMESMADQQIHDREFRIRHARRQLRGPLLLRGLLPITATAIFIGLLGWSSLPAVDVIARALSR
jgi:hypothetical protein